MGGLADGGWERAAAAWEAPRGAGSRIPTTCVAVYGARLPGFGGVFSPWPGAKGERGDLIYVFFYYFLHILLKFMDPGAGTGASPGRC